MPVRYHYDYDMVLLVISNTWIDCELCYFYIYFYRLLLGIEDLVFLV